jgi:hypothetical protein
MPNGGVSSRTLIWKALFGIRQSTVHAVLNPTFLPSFGTRLKRAENLTGVDQKGQRSQRLEGAEAAVEVFDFQNDGVHRESRVKEIYDDYFVDILPIEKASERDHRLSGSMPSTTVCLFLNLAAWKCPPTSFSNSP